MATPPTTISKKPPAKKKAKAAPRKKPVSLKAGPTRIITLKNQRFVDEYLIDLNATQAALRAGYSQQTAYSIGHELLKKPEIASEITKRQADRLQRIEIDQDKIVRELLNIAHADANELVEYRRTCCRFCWGEGFQYQRTANEMESDLAEYDREVDLNNARPADQRKKLRPFNERGGIGYDMRKEPHEDCAECFGQGVGNTFVKDTRYLSPAARALYAGVKQTKDGLEIKMHDKQGFIQLLMRHAGMLNDKIKLQGDAENPITALLQQVMGTGLPVTKDDA